MEEVIAQATADALALEVGGANAIMVENFFDAPFAKETVPPVTVAAMTSAVLAIREVTHLPLGINVLRNDIRSAISIAHICGAQFVRCNVYVGASVTDQGLIEGAARTAILTRKELDADVAIWADVCVKHARQLGTEVIEEAAKDAVLRGLADALIVSGAATGSLTDPADARAVKLALPSTPILIGSGFDIGTASFLLAHADGAIVGTSLKPGHDITQPVSSERVRLLRAAMLPA